MEQELRFYVNANFIGIMKRLDRSIKQQQEKIENCHKYKLYSQLSQHQNILKILKYIKN